MINRELKQSTTHSWNIKESMKQFDKVRNINYWCKPWPSPFYIFHMRQWVLFEDGQGVEFGHSDSEFGLSIKQNSIVTLTQILICAGRCIVIVMLIYLHIRICVSVATPFSLILSPKSESECPNSKPWPSIILHSSFISFFISTNFFNSTFTLIDNCSLAFYLQAPN
jgi:hypothetical protein